jgi:hypothetical protein
MASGRLRRKHSERASSPEDPPGMPGISTPIVQPTSKRAKFEAKYHTVSTSDTDVLGEFMFSILSTLFTQYISGPAEDLDVCCLRTFPSP